MNLTILTRNLNAAVLALCAALAASPAYANDLETEDGQAILDDEATPMAVKKYRITIKNLTDHQILTPAVTASHNVAFDLFKVGTKASEGLAIVAEDGNTDKLVAEVDSSPLVKDVVVSPATMPGESKSYEITADHDNQRLSLAGMLATTNDGLYAIMDKRIYKYRKVIAYAYAYDAGSEKNSEKCMYVPGPPCGSHGVRDPEDGVIHMHPNIKGIGDIPKNFDWKKKVAKITIERIQ